MQNPWSIPFLPCTNTKTVILEVSIKWVFQMTRGKKAFKINKHWIPDLLGQRICWSAWAYEEHVGLEDVINKQSSQFDTGHFLSQPQNCDDKKGEIRACLPWQVLWCYLGRWSLGFFINRNSINIATNLNPLNAAKALIYNRMKKGNQKI